MISAKEYCYDTLERRMYRIYEQAERLANLDIPVLVVGESGTGKRALSEYVHKRGKRRHAPFVSINCASIPENLIEAELFGFYQGPILIKGKLETARDGILLLQKIDEMPLSVQQKLLQVLKEKQFSRIDDSLKIGFQARVLATTQHDMTRLVEQNQFIRELSYYFECVVLKLPPLTERTKDISVFVDHFLEELVTSNKREVRLSPEVYNFLCQKDWHGNVRELKNYITKIYYLTSKNLIAVQDIYQSGLEKEVSFESMDLAPLTSHSALSLSEMEREHILRTLEMTGGNKSHAARTLKISLKTLRNKLKVYGTFQPEELSLQS